MLSRSESKAGAVANRSAFSLMTAGNMRRGSSPILAVASSARIQACADVDAPLLGPVSLLTIMLRRSSDPLIAKSRRAAGSVPEQDHFGEGDVAQNGRMGAFIIFGRPAGEIAADKAGRRPVCIQDD